jgi:hypothetical protein
LIGSCANASHANRRGNKHGPYPAFATIDSRPALTQIIRQLTGLRDSRELAGPIMEEYEMVGISVP